MLTRREQAEATQAAIIEAGRELLRQKDAKKVLVSDIMRQCGLSAGLFYHYYKSKDAFFASLATREWNRGKQILKDESIEPVQRLRQYCLAMIQKTVDYDPQFRRNLNAYRMTDEYLHEREQNYQDDLMYRWITEYLLDCIEKKIFAPEIPTDYIAKLMVYVVHGIDFNAALYKRTWNDLQWCNTFFDDVEERFLRPYLLVPEGASVTEG